MEWIVSKTALAKTEQSVTRKMEIVTVQLGMREMTVKMVITECFQVV